MSSVQDSETCPQCGGTYYVEFNCRTYEEYKICERCGKMERYLMIRDNASNAVLDENGAPKYISENKDGYGSMLFVMNKGVSTMHSLQEPFDLEEAKANFLKNLENPNVNKENSYFTYWDVENKKIVVLYGDDPGEYGQCEVSVDASEAPF